MSEPLHVPARLRPWLKAGLTFLLTETPEEAQALRRTAAARPSAPASSSSERAMPPRPVPSQAAAMPERPAASGAGRDLPGRPVRQEPAPAPEPARPATQARPANLPFNRSALPFAEWPEAWTALFRRRPLPERPMVIWTYAGLGDDLMGRPDPARQQVIVRMLKSLGHPAGTHVFWPLDIPGVQEAPAGASLFWSGEAHLRPRVLLVFGQEAARSMGLEDSLSLFRAETRQGRRIVLLPPPADLAGDETVFGRSFAFLSRLLNFCAGSGQ